MPSRQVGYAIRVPCLFSSAKFNPSKSNEVEKHEPLIDIILDPHGGKVEQCIRLLDCGNWQSVGLGNYQDLLGFSGEPIHRHRLWYVRLCVEVL